ncbi:MAG TPA: hypothetical protein VFD47_03985 [Actinomycetota bacterium]|nr:hypothetical protein [Actinomycetota bacterium]
MPDSVGTEIVERGPDTFRPAGFSCVNREAEAEFVRRLSEHAELALERRTFDARKTEPHDRCVGLLHHLDGSVRGLHAVVARRVNDETHVATSRLEPIAHGTPHLVRIHSVANVRYRGERRFRVDDVLFRLCLGERLGDDLQVAGLPDLGAHRQVDVDELLKVREALRVSSVDQRQGVSGIAAVSPGEFGGGIGGDAALEMNVQLDLRVGFEIELVESGQPSLLAVRFSTPYVRNETGTTAFN